MITKIAGFFLSKRTKEIDSWKGREAELQLKTLSRLLKKAKDTSFGKANGFSDILSEGIESFSQRLPLREYEDFREDIMRMVRGEASVLWPGVCHNFAQSSGTSGGRSKYIPVTEDGLKLNHYKGASYSVALYLASNPNSRIFSGKGLILGGSFATQVEELKRGVVVGDLSATLIQRINPFVNFFRVPDKHTALLEDWQQKLPLIAEKAVKANITNLSGVPSWMMHVLRKALEISGKSSLQQLWPNLEVFFHGGISFVPYRSEYEALCEGLDMHFSEVYNASEGYFAVEDPRKESREGAGMTLLVDSGVYYEFLPLGAEIPVGIDAIQPGKVYELVVSTVNGLWRYRIGDTVRIESLNPVKITIAGRTKSFINAFGEELMENNAERAVAEACRLSGASILNYTVAPVYAHAEDKGRHQWIIEWDKQPSSLVEFIGILDENLRKLNSDYDAKRSHDLFLDIPEVVSVPTGTFNLWLTTFGNGKLGGQRKVPRLSNDRSIADSILSL